MSGQQLLPAPEPSVRRGLDQAERLRTFARLAAYGFVRRIPRDQIYLDPQERAAVATAPNPFIEALFEAAIKLFFEWLGIELPNQFAGRVALDILEQPRCAMPDLIVDSAQARVCQWPRGHVVRFWKTFDTLYGLSPADTTSAFVEGFRQWEKSCGIRFEYTDRSPNVVATAGRIDGGGGTLAFAYFPCGATPTSSFAQKYDTSEWRGLSRDAVWRRLHNTVWHEAGHSIGHDHKNRGIMKPFMDASIIEPSDFERQISEPLYGPVITGPVDPPPTDPTDPTPTDPPTPTPGPRGRLVTSWPGTAGRTLELWEV